MQTYDIKTISINDPLYPSGLKALEDAPCAIFARGNLQLLTDRRPRLGVVGSRKSTSYGRGVTASLVKDTVRCGAIIVSGLAIGIDGIAHRSTIEAGGATIAVLPSDLHRIYPASHTGLAQQILNSNGLLISEHADHPNIKPYEFLQRNRLIAALSNVILVTEAAIKSGTLSTVEHAERLHKQIGAVPGNITNPMSKGSNKLFYDGVQPVLDYKDLLIMLGLNEKLIKFKRYKPKNEIEALILTWLNNDQYNTNELAEYTQLSVQILNAHLTILEMNDVIIESSTNTWRINA